MIKIIVGFMLSFVIALVFLPWIIKLIRKFSCSQTILKYVEEHKSKQGTPTMGGVVFFVSTLIVAVIMLKYSTPVAMCIAVGVGFALVGFMDDFIKVKLKQNLGLRPYQKIVGQVGIALILAIYIYFWSPNKSVIYLPFTFKAIDLGVWIIPLVVIVCLATTNSVNLTDGLDGLAGQVSWVYFAFLVFLIFVQRDKMSILYLDSEEYDGLILLSVCLIGGILAFLIFNVSKARVFMGDTGSLSLGGFIGSISIFSLNSFFIPLIGIMFVISSISVIVQVVYYKRTKKRVFLMSPIHHHFQLKGYSETQIGYVYALITAICGILAILQYL